MQTLPGGPGRQQRPAAWVRQHSYKITPTVARALNEVLHVTEASQLPLAVPLLFPVFGILVLFTESLWLLTLQVERGLPGVVSVHMLMSQRVKTVYSS